jgi:hypothetical protein
MLDSYLTEASAVDASMAQAIFSQFSRASSTMGLDTGVSVGDGAAYLANRARNIADGSSMMQPVSWDLPVSSQASSSVTTSNQRHNTSTTSVSM